MKKKVLVSILALLALTSCNSTISSASDNSIDSSTSVPNTSVNEAEETVYYLTGDLDLGQNRHVALLKNGNTYTYENVKLRRGNSFTIRSKDSVITADALVNPIGFEAGNNGYIRVLNEGVYDLTLDDTETPKLSLTKKDSTYKTVKLILADGQEFEFEKNDDFTFTLDDVNLRYRDLFHIQLDDETLKYNAFDYNDVYYDVLRFDEESAFIIQKGTFSFKLDFSKNNPLLCSSDLFTKPQELPTTPETYRTLVDSLVHQFANDGSDYKLTYVEETSDTKTEIKYHEMFNANEYYYEEIYGEGNDQETRIINRYFNDKNYYEIRTYKDSDGEIISDASHKSSVVGYLVGETPMENGKTNGTVITKAKEYITEEKALSNLISSIGSQEVTVKNYFDYVLEQPHLSSFKRLDQDYLADLELDCSYRWQYGDGMSVKARNVEYQTNKANKAFVNEVEFLTDNNGHVESGYVKFTDYGSNTSNYEGGELFDTEGNLNINSSYIPTRVRTYTFTYEYEERQTVTSFHLEPSDFIANYIMCTPEINIELSDYSAIKQDDYKPIDCDPFDALDLDNYIVVEYDEAFLKPGTGPEGSKNYYPKKAGTTTLVIGTLYNDVTSEIIVNISYKSTGNPSLSFSPSSGTYYQGKTYEFSVSPSTGYDPRVRLESSRPDIVNIVEVDEEATQYNQGKVNFKLEMLAVTSETITITATSTVYSNVKSTLNIYGVKEPVTSKLVADKYYFGNENTFIELKEDYTGVVQNETGSYDFVYEMDGTSIKLVSSDSISSMSATLYLVNTYNPTYPSFYYISYPTIKDMNDNTISGFSSRGCPMWTPQKLLSNLVETTNSWTLKRTSIVWGVDYNNYTTPVMALSDGTHTIEFAWEFYSSSSYPYGKVDTSRSYFKVDGVHPSSYSDYSKYAITIDSFTANSITITLSKDGFSNLFGTGTYTFTLVD